MRLFAFVLLAALAPPAQPADEDYRVYTEHPRLLLPAQRQRLLRRERERQSMRWQQFDTLVRGKARLPEPGFALALYSIVAQDDSSCRLAVESVSQKSPIRETAIVYDWCHNLLAPADKAQFETRLAAPLTPNSFSTARDLAFAAIATGNAAQLKSVHAWWRTEAQGLREGKRAIGNQDIYPLMELLHVVRDNLTTDLREDAVEVFRELVVQRLLSYYPATYPAPENEYRIPYFSGKGEPDLRTAALSRAAEFALVAYDNNARQTQFLQGWLLHDRFALRGPFGAPYEFLWANPYQPGLPFDKLPPHHHDARTGRLLLRSSWNEDATWVGYFGRSTQMFRDGRIQLLTMRQPLTVGDSVLYPASGEVNIRVTPDSAADWFFVGLEPVATYNIEVDLEDMTDADTDPGGILPLTFTRADNQQVRIRKPRS
jgi:hypothetical protein